MGDLLDWKLSQLSRQSDTLDESPVHLKAT